MSDIDENEYLLRLNHRQLRLVERAMNLYSRLGAGQFEEMFDEFQFMFPQDSKNWASRWDLKIKYADPMKEELLGLKDGANLGISTVPGRAREEVCIAYEINKVVQNTIATEENHNAISVWHHTPIKMSSVPLPIVEKVLINQIRKEKLNKV
jgi:hypothetical protein